MRRLLRWGKSPFTAISPHANNPGPHPAIVWRPKGGETTPPLSPKYPDYMMSLNPVGYWRLNETSGTTAYDETGVQDGTYAAGVTLNAAGLLPHESYSSNRAVDFNKANDGRVAIPFDPSHQTSNLTIACWVKPESIGGNLLGYQFILVRGTYPTATDSSFAFIMLSDGKLRLTIRSAPGTPEHLISTGSLQAGNTYFVAVTYDGSDVNFYIDGQPAGSSSTTISSLYATFEGFTIGANRESAWHEPWSGIIDEVAYFGTALSPSEVLTAYNYGVYGQT